MQPHIVSRSEPPRRRAKIELTPRSAMSLAGRVKWFRANRGFGFIVPDDGGPDVFLHASIVHQYGIRECDVVKDLRVVYCAADPKPGQRPEAICVLTA